MIAKKCREQFSDCSTGNGGGRYYETKGHAVNAFADALKVYNLGFDGTELLDFYGDEGRKMLAVLDDSLAPVGSAVLSWYRMPSGRYEFVGYLA